MEFKDLPIIVLTIILVGMLIGVGVLSLDKFGEAAKQSTTITNESFTVPAVNSTVTLTNGNMTTFTQVLNSTLDAWDSSNYTVVLASGVLNNTANGSCSAGDTCYAYYTYDDYSRKPVESIWGSRDAVGDISITWLDLIVTITILAIIIGLVISGFYFARR